MKLTLVHAPFGHRVFSENLRVVDEEFILPPPLILSYVAAIAERAGHQVDLIDAHATGITMKQAAERIIASGAEALGFRADVYNFHQTLAWIRFLKEATGLPVIVGGIGMTEYPSACMAHREIDFGIVGEAIRSLPALLASPDLAHGAFEHGVPGLVYRDGDAVVVNPPADSVPFDEYPQPARHLLPNHLYRSFVSKRKNFTIAVTSTGCPYRCTFCEIAPLTYRKRSPELVVEEVESCCREHGVREIDFFDATFFIDRERTIEICDRITSLGLDLEWTCRSRVDLVDDELLQAATRAGLRMIFFGIESASPEILTNVNKEIEPSQVHAAIALCRQHGVRSLGFFMLGSPGETEETAEQTIRFMQSLDLDFVQVCRTIAKPGTELNRDLVAETGRDYWDEFVRGTAPEARLPAPWTDLSQEQVERYLRKAYLGFFLRPRMILKTAAGARSFAELARYVRVGSRMLIDHTTDVD